MSLALVATLSCGCGWEDRFVPPGDAAPGVDSATGLDGGPVDGGPGTDAAGTDAIALSTDSGGCVNFALEFDGTDDRIAVADDDAAFDSFGPITLEAWIRPTALTGEVHIVSHHDHFANLGYMLLLMPPGRLQLRYYDGAQNNQVGGGTGTEVLMNAWQHVAGTFDGTTLRVFVDGAEVASNPISATMSPDYDGPVSIGAASYTDMFFHFEGAIDEVHVSNVARYTGPFTRPAAPFVVDADTVALWHFDEGTGQTVADATGAHDGTLGDGPMVFMDDPAWIPAPCIAEMP